ncbi:MAG: RsmD family RNA methyltransferase, partial [bacterium]
LSELIQDARVLDLFCGSGGLGMEALSRGASLAHFVDRSFKALSAVRENVTLCGFQEKAIITCQDTFRFLRHYREFGGEPFDVVFASPPYRSADPQRLLDAISEAQVTAPGGFICLEYSRHTPSPISSFLKLQRRKVLGETVMEVWETPSLSSDE